MWVQQAAQPFGAILYLLNIGYFHIGMRWAIRAPYVLRGGHACFTTRRFVIRTPGDGLVCIDTSNSLLLSTFFPSYHLFFSFFFSFYFFM